MKTYSVKEFQINISRRGLCQYQLFLVSVKILKKELYHRSSSQILIIPSRIYHVSSLLKLFFQYSSLNFLLQQFTIKSWVTCQNKFNMFLSVGFKKHVRPTSPDVPSFVPRDVPHLGPVDVPWTSPFKTFEYLFFQ